MGTTMAEDNQLILDNVIWDYVTRVRYPNNIEDIVGSYGKWMGVASLLFTAGAPLLATPLGWPMVIVGGPTHIAGWAGGLSGNAKNFVDQLRFVEAAQAVRINVSVAVSALQRNSRHVDAILQFKVTFQVDAHREADKTSVLYQDYVSFFVRPSDGDLNDWQLNTAGVSPDNEIATINYTNTHSWTAAAGIQPGSSGGSGGYSFTTETTVAIPEFKLVGSLASGGFIWAALMQQAYDGTTPGMYSTPEDIIVKHPMTRWFKDPPSVAWGGALPLSLLATFTSRDGSAPDRKTAAFDFVATQKVMYGYVGGRWGAEGAKLGGQPMMVPALVKATGRLVLDFTAQSAAITVPSFAFSTIAEGAS